LRKFIFLIFLVEASILVAGCATEPSSTPSSRQQAEADLVVGFQAWNSIALLKPNVSDPSLTSFRVRSFTKTGVVKLIESLHIPGGFVVVILDRRYSPGRHTMTEEMDEIQTFFEGLGFQRVAFQDAAGWTREEGMPIVRDSAQTAAPK
jgi:hypothetical protein